VENISIPPAFPAALPKEERRRSKKEESGKFSKKKN